MISNFRLSTNSKRAVSDIKEVMENGNLFSGAVASIPLFQIFASPSITGGVLETSVTIREYDWDTFAKSLTTTSKIVRERIFSIAYEQEIYTYGKERDFWRCVSEAAK